MTQWTDAMVDVETTGVNGHINGIIQLSTILFNYEEQKVGPSFDRCPMLLPFRQWDMSTREFWLVKNRTVFNTIIARQEPAQQVFTDYDLFLRKHGAMGGVRFWAKPLMFDWSFVASHMEQSHLPMPFHYRVARDLNSFMAGQLGHPEDPRREAEVPFPEGGSVHNALHDCAYQIDMLFHAG